MADDYALNSSRLGELPAGLASQANYSGCLGRGEQGLGRLSGLSTMRRNSGRKRSHTSTATPMGKVRIGRRALTLWSGSLMKSPAIFRIPRPENPCTTRRIEGCWRR